MFTTGINELWLNLREFVFPQLCLACGRGLRPGQLPAFCPACRKVIRFIGEPSCTVCGRSFDKSGGMSHICGYCLKHSWNFSRARAVVSYEGPIAEMIRQFKYGGKMYGLETMAALSREFWQNQSRPGTDLILPVPLHPGRLRQRGFNQALVLSRKLFAEGKKKINPFILERCRPTQPQAGLNGVQRRGNVRNAFRVNGSGRIQGKRILLVDDVFTTGATVNECARILKKNKAAEVEVFTFARVAEKLG